MLQGGKRVPSCARLPGLLALAAMLGSGCQFVPKSKLTAVENQHRALSEQNKAQLAEIETLQVRSRELEDRLAQAENEAAQLDEQLATGQGPNDALRHERQRLRSQFAGLLSSRRGPPSERLASLARRHPGVRFDPLSGVSRFEAEVLFETGSAELPSASHSALRRIAALLNSDEGRNLNVMVAGHTDDQRIAGLEVRERYPTNWHLSVARAVAVEEYLRRHQVAGERIGVAGFGPHQPVVANDSDDSRQLNRRVEIFLVEPTAPVIGRTDTMPGLY